MNETPSPPAELSEQQKEFCRQYIIDFKAARAARAAGYAPGMVRGHAWELVQDVAIDAEIRRLNKERAERTRLSADRVVLELAAIAYSTLDHYATDDAGNVELTDDAPPLAIHALAGIRKKVRKLGKADDAITESDVEIKLWDKPAALKMLMLHLGMIEKKMLVAGDPDKPLKGEVKHEHTAALPADGTIAECLRRLGLPLPGGVPADGR